MRGNVAGASGIAIVAPSSPQITLFLDYFKVRVSVSQQLYSHTDAAKAAANYRHMLVLNRL